MHKLYEHDIIQNPVISAIVLRSFCQSYYDTKDKKSGPILPLSMPILPVVYNKQIVNKLYSRNMNGGLFKAIAEDKALFVGLQQNMESMSKQTFEALNFCFTSGLLDYDLKTTELIPIKMQKGRSMQNISDIMFEGFREIDATAKRLGYWFAVLRTEHLLTILNIRY